MKLYHITPRKNVKSILRNGLMPAHRKGICRGSGEPSAVFLTNDVERIIRTQTGERWIKDYDAVVLEVNTSDLIITPSIFLAYDPPLISTYEFICRYVPPQNIHLHHKSINGSHYSGVGRMLTADT